MFLALLVLLAGSGQFQARIQEGIAALDKGNLAQAQKNLEEATFLAPENAGAWLLLAQTYAKQQKQKPALAAAEKAERLGAEDPDVLQGLMHFYTELQPDLAKATSLGIRYAEKTPRDATAWRRVAALYMQMGQPDEAIAAGTRGLSVDHSAELHSLLGRAYAERKDWGKATAELTEALKLSPYDEEAHFRLAQAHLFQQNFPSAVAVLTNARKTFDKSPQIELALGVAYYGSRRFREAVDQFLKTMQLAPDLPQPYVFLGRIMEHATDRLAEVIERFAQFESRNPNSPLGYLLHAKALIARLPPANYPAEAAAALDLLKKSLALKEDDAEAHYLISVLLERKREFQDAASHLERSVVLNPKDPAPHYRLARVYYRLGRKEEAARERRLHEKLSEEQENTMGGRGMVVERPRSPSPGPEK